MAEDKKPPQIPPINPPKRADDQGNIVVEELLRIYDPTTQKNFVVRKF